MITEKDKKYRKEYYKNHKEYFKKYKEEYRKSHLQYFSDKVNKWQKEHHAETKKFQYKWMRENPVKVKAHAKFKRAVINGSIKRQPCKICGYVKADGHHEDYSKPLEVIWLCRKHHKELHAKIKLLVN